MDDQGNATVVWQQKVGQVDNIYARRFSSGNWGTVTLLDTGPGEANGTQVAMDDNGNAMVVWLQYDGAYISVYARGYSAGAWGPVKLMENENGNASFPQVVMDSDGNAMAIWLQHAGTDPLLGDTNVIYYNRFSSGTWGVAKLVGTLDGDFTSPRIAMDSHGNATVVCIRIRYWWGAGIPNMVSTPTVSRRELGDAHAFRAE